MDEKDIKINADSQTNPKEGEAVPAPASTIEVASTNDTVDAKQTTDTTEINNPVPASEPTSSEVVTAKSNWLMYTLTGLAVVVLLVALVFALEKRGLIGTTFFVSAPTAVAVVNGVEITRRDYDSGVAQRMEMAASQGVDTTDVATKAQIETQALETLINGELLRQAAVEQGFTVEQVAIDARYNEIRDGVGGPEALLARMNQIGIDEATLRRDIANDSLIQQYIEANVDLAAVTVSEEEIVAFYEGRGGEASGLPPLVEVRDQVVQALRSEKEQGLVQSLIDSLRTEAKIEMKL